MPYIVTTKRPGDARHGSPRRIAGTDRFTIQAYLHGHALARNGNTHNPTPIYSYVLLLDGVPVDSSSTERVLRAAAKAPDALDTYGRFNAGRGGQGTLSERGTTCTIDTTRRAVATLEEARWFAQHPGWHYTGADDEPAGKVRRAARTLPESGGTVGPLPDGTVIEVERVDWSLLARSCNPPLPITGPVGAEWTEAEKQQILDTFNARPVAR